MMTEIQALALAGMLFLIIIWLGVLTDRLSRLRQAWDSKMRGMQVELDALSHSVYVKDKTPSASADYTIDLRVPETLGQSAKTVALKALEDKKARHKSSRKYPPQRKKTTKSGGIKK